MPARSKTASQAKAPRQPKTAAQSKTATQAKTTSQGKITGKTAIKTAAAEDKIDRRRERGEASIQKIIDAAIDLIADEGLGSVTMQRIAEQIRSSSALVVFHFKSKENLFQAVLQYLSDLYDEIWVRLVRDERRTTMERMIGSIDCAQEFARRYPKGVSVFIAFGGDRKSMRLYRKIALPSDQVYIAEGRRLLGEIARDGGYHEVDLDALTDSLNYLIHGAWYWDHLNPRRSESDVLHHCALMILHQAFPRHVAAGEVPTKRGVKPSTRAPRG